MTERNIPLRAVVRGGPETQIELGRDLRDVALGASRIWAEARAKARTAEDAEEFGKGAAKVYLAALAELNAGFEPGPESPAGSV